MRFDIKTNFPEVQRALAQLQSDVARKATASALNKTVALARTAMSHEIRAEFVLPAAKVSQALRINKAKASGGKFALQASLESPAKRGRSLNLANFLVGKGTNSKGVRIRIKRGGPIKTIPGAFLINSGKTVMIRVGKRRLPIKALQTIDVAQMFNTRRINIKVLKVIEQRFPEQFANEATFFTNKFNAGR